MFGQSNPIQNETLSLIFLNKILSVEWLVINNLKINQQQQKQLQTTLYNIYLIFNLNPSRYVTLCIFINIYINTYILYTYAITITINCLFIGLICVHLNLFIIHMYINKSAYSKLTLILNFQLISTLGFALLFLAMWGT